MRLIELVSYFEFAPRMLIEDTMSAMRRTRELEQEINELDKRHSALRVLYCDVSI